MSNTDRWEKRRKLHSDSIDEDNMIRLHEYDMYDQALQNLKHLVNERRKIEPDKRAAYDIAIGQAQYDLHERMHDEIPKMAIDQDIKLGKYRNLYHDPTDDSDNDVIQLRKKKSSKPKTKSKTKSKRVVKKCKCK
jgi:hypothetical protein